ncbi:MAG TPA: CocE/NonD family hydrolase [Acidimicrobiales bacterium]|nr:CocE/NonD family hydrolase [Acidimicrobiales bacterium]
MEPDQAAGPPVENFEARVEMADGVELSVGLRVPSPGGDSASRQSTKVPVLLDCHPYRKDDLFSFRGLGLYESFNDRGFATARLDVRGTGRSAGTVPSSEYSLTEIGDCVEVIDWLSRQSWCNGAVGMWGISWSAINTLLVAGRRPEALKACMAIHPSDELFASDIHFIDGLLHYDLYELSIDLLNSVTPGPEFELDEQMLADRFDQPPWMGGWLQHQTNDGYWRLRSLAPHYERIACPVFLVGGWYDGYHECVFRLLERLDVPVEACIGPWSHTLPHMGGPGPAVDWPSQACDWWDRWLRPTGAGAASTTGRAAADADPNGSGPRRKVQLYARSWHPPAPRCTTVNGAWHTLESWPVPDMTATSFTLAPGHLEPEAAPGSAPAPAATPGPEAAPAPGSVRDPHGIDRVVVDSPPWIGSEVGHWWGDLAQDQSTLDADCVVFDSEALGEGLEVLGNPLLTLILDPCPGAQLYARLEDLAPDGAVTLVTGVGAAVPASRPAGSPEGPVELRLPLHWTSWNFERDHRIRLSLSSALWPMFWPAARAGPVSVVIGAGGSGPPGADGSEGLSSSRLVLPVPPASWGSDEAPPALELPEQTSPPVSALRPEATWENANANGRWEFTWATSGEQSFDFGTMGISQRLSFSVTGRPETDAAADGEAALSVTTGTRALAWRLASRLESQGDRFRYSVRRELFDGERRIRKRAWSYEIPRHEA